MFDRRISLLAGTIVVLTSAQALAAEPAKGGKAAAEVKASAPEAKAATAEAKPATAETEAAPAEAAPATSEAESSSGGAGLFEQSTAAASGGSAASMGGGPRLSLSGYMRGDVFVGRVPDESKADLKAAYGEMALVARTEKGTYGDGYAEARIRYGLWGDQRPNTVDLREAYVNAYLGPVDLRVGKQIIVWGRADLLNPTNNITPNDMRVRSPIEDDRRVGNVGVRANYRLSPIRLEGVWMPSYVATELPTVALPKYVSFGNPVYPSPSQQNWLEALRMHLELPSFEMSVSYLYGYAPMPGLTLGSLAFRVKPSEADPSVAIARTAYKHQVVGFDFSTSLADLVGLRIEAAYRRPSDYKNLLHAPRPDAQYALGLDHSFGSVMVIVQYLGRYTFDWKKRTEPSMSLNPNYLVVESQQEADDNRAMYEEAITDELARINQIIFNQTEKVQHLVTARVEWLTLHETLSLSAIGMVNASTKEWMTMPKLGYRMSDSMMVYVGAEVGSGPHGTLFGLVDKRLSAGYVELRSTF